MKRVRLCLSHLHVCDNLFRILERMNSAVWDANVIVQPTYMYLRSVLHAYHSTRSLWLSNTNLLSALFVRTSFGACSFSVAAPKIRNSLHAALRTLRMCVRVLTFSVVTPRLTVSSRLSNHPLSAFLIARQVRLLLFTCWLRPTTCTSLTSFLFV